MAWTSCEVGAVSPSLRGATETDLNVSGCENDSQRRSTECNDSRCIVGEREMAIRPSRYCLGSPARSIQIITSPSAK